MVATAGLFLVPEEDWAHKVLWIEGLEITWFLALWIAQSRELWHDTLRRSEHAEVPTVTGDDGTPVPFRVVPFNKRGRCTSPEWRKELLEDASAAPYTDVFLFSHGWNNDWPTALHRYGEFIEGYQAFRRDEGLPVPDGYRPLLVGVHWPSAILTFDYEDAPAMAAGGTLLGRSDEEALAVLEDELAEVDAHALRSIAETNGPPDANLAALLAPLLTDADEVGAPAPKAPQLLATWQESGQSFEGTGEFGAIGAIGAAGEGVAAAGFFSTARDAIRQVTVWLMKDRAGRVGARGVAPLLADLQAVAPKARFHLIGHSYGCKVLLSAIAIQPPARKVHSLLLLQAAVNHRCFAADRGDGQPGGYAVTLDRVVAPIVVTFSDKDQSLRKIFHWLMRRPDDLGEVAIAADDGITPPSRFAALGGWGPTGAEATTVHLPMQHAKDVYEELTSPTVRIVALASHDDITSHGAIANPGTYWALYCSTVAGVVTPTP